MSPPRHDDQFAWFAPLLPCRASARAENSKGNEARGTTGTMDDIEILHADLPRGCFRAVLFDFDGTLSLIREGWVQIMVPMMVAELRLTGTTEDEESLAAHVGDFVMRLNGRPTIFQMNQLAEEVRQRGGTPREPSEYEARYLDLLLRRVRSRTDAIARGQARPEDWAVPGSHAFLERLRQHGLELYMASGTDLSSVRHEAELLALAPYFGPHIYGPAQPGDGFSKRAVLERMLRDSGLRGDEVIAFGDGFVEIEEVKRIGGVAVAVASDEVQRRGIHRWKRDRLVQAGADVVIGDYRHLDWLMQFFFDERRG
jgi:phosphoglycolate phosphatase-like HAD superfamily hydrolase